MQIADHSFQILDLNMTMALLRRHAASILVGSAIGWAVLALFLAQLPDRYTAEAVMMGKDGDNSVQELDGIRIDAHMDAALGSEADAQLMRSDGFLTRLTNAIGAPAILAGAPKSSWIDRLRSWAGLAPQAASDTPEIQAFKILKRNLRVLGDDKNPVLMVRYTDRDPSMAAQIANEAANQLLADHRRAHERDLGGMVSALHDQIAQLDRQIQSTTEEAAHLREHLNYFATPSGSILAQQITDATQALSDATIEVSSANERYHAALAGTGPGRDDRTLNELFDSPTLQDLVMREATLKQDDDELASRLGDRHPDRIRVQERLASARAAVRTEISRLLVSLKDKLTEAQRHQKALQDRLSELRAKTGEAGQTDLLIQTSERRLDALTNAQNGLTRLLQQLEFGTADSGGMHVASLAVPPLLPSQPHRLLGFSIGFLVIATLMAATAVMRGVLVGEFVSPAAAIGAGVAREVFTMPLIQRASRRRLLQDGAAEGRRLDHYLMRHIRDVALWMTAEKTVRPLVAAVSSLDPGEGKTTLSLLLAYGLTCMGRRTLVLDCDHSNSTASRHLGAIASAPDAPVVDGKHGFEIRRTDCADLFFATADKSLCLAAFAGDLKPLRSRIDELTGEFSVVILDMPPVSLVTEAVNLIHLSSCHLVVADWKAARFDRLARIRALLGRYRARADVIIFNRYPDDPRLRRALRRSGYDPEERLLDAA